ncbi:MAG: efflux RND transporter permease subunit [Bryobacteraceae bacterium]|nr:efflux RND transporter permease subunit [Bryobacteraceae bacterium]
MQKLAEVCVRRPVFAAMLILALMVVGGVSFFLLGLDRFPNVDLPIVTVTTAQPGASPTEIEREITERVEAAVNTVSGIEELRSVSSEGISNVVVQFQLGRGVDAAAAEVRQKVDLILNELPRTAEKPVVQKINSDTADVLLYAVTSPRELVALTELVDKQIVDRLSSVNGVGKVSIYGGRKREVQILVDLDRLRAYSLTVSDIAKALRAQNLELPGGTLDQGARSLTVKTMGKVERVEDFARLVIKQTAGYAVRISDVAEVRDAGKEARSVARRNGEPALVLAVAKQSGVNTVAVIDAVQERLDEVRAGLPPDVKLTMVRDQSEFIRASLSSIEEHLVVGAILAALVVYVFLGNWRSTVIAALAIPASIIASFGLMAALGYTLNLMTMLALTLMVGIVIDDAIVVLENIVKVMEEKGLTPEQAAIEGTREIGLAVMATTLSLLAVFVPIGFMGGIVGKFMSSFGFTSAAAIAVSLLVSFTLTPSLAAKWLKHNAHAPASGQSALNRWLDEHYTRLLRWSMEHRAAMAWLCVAVVLSTIPLGMLTGFQFIAQDDESEYEVSVRLPEGASLAATESVMEDMARTIRRDVPGVESTLSIPGFNSLQKVNQGTILVRLVPASARELDQKSLVAFTRQKLLRYPSDIYTSVQPVDPFSGGEKNTEVQFVLRGPDLETLGDYSGRALAKMKTNPKLADSDRSFIPGKPELRLMIDRERAADLGVNIDDLAGAVNSLLAGELTGSYGEGKNLYDIRLRARLSERGSAQRLQEILVPRGVPGDTETRGLVPLSQLARFSPGTGPGSIDRLNRQRQVTLYANLAPGASQSEAVTAIRQAVAELKMEPAYSEALTGNAKELEKTGYYFLLAVGLTFVFMYMVLAAQFESLIHPVTILLTLPLSVPFALLSSYLAGQPLNIFSMLGILLLFGVVKKNAILQIDHTNQLRSGGMPRDEAILTANRDRLRPILMTTIALVAGMIPLVVGQGQGAETNRSIGLLVVGGQSLCLLLTLLAVPVFYSLFEDLSLWLRARLTAPAAAPLAGPLN